MNETKSTPAAKLAAEIQPLLPEGWRASEAIGLDLMGGSTPEFVLINTRMPENCRYHGQREGAEQRKLKRQIWRQNCAEAADYITQLITDNFVNVRVRNENTTLYVYPMKEAK